MTDQRPETMSGAPSPRPFLNEIRYRRHRIVWDVRPEVGTLLWTGKAAVVALDDGSVQKHIQKIAADVHRNSEDETRAFLITAAKQWIDAKIARAGGAESRFGSVIVWDASFSVGIQQIDDQHRELINIINCLIENEDAAGHSEPIADVLDRMTKYADYHFETEEALMARYNYPEYESHRDEHTRFKMTTAKFCMDALVRKETLPDELLAYLRTWLTQHILESDMKYKAFFLERGLS